MTNLEKIVFGLAILIVCGGAATVGFVPFALLLLSFLYDYVLSLSPIVGIGLYILFIMGYGAAWLWLMIVLYRWISRVAKRINS